MNILIIGNGAREHVFFKLLTESSVKTNLFSINPNAAIQKLSSPTFKPFSFNLVKEIIKSSAIEMVIVGPENPLIDGVYDFIKSDSEINHVSVIGPSRNGAQLEGSKKFAKDFMYRNSIPTASSKTFTKETFLNACDFIKKSSAPYVLKADGLAAGKGVLIIDELTKAKKELKSILNDNLFGSAGSKVVIEEFLSGVELSVFVITDGKNYKILPEAKDYKRIGENDTGLNTGGMGAVSPVPFANREFMDKVENQVIIPTIKGLINENIDYSGFIFFGLISVKGDPYVIEYNCRLGDPETEVVLPRLKSDLLDLFDGIASDTLSERDVVIDPRSAATVMLVSGGYPEKYEKGKEISIGDVHQKSIVFHAGTKQNEGATVTNGGRVMSVTSYGKDIESSLKVSYESIENISFEKMYYRKDIGQDLVKKN